MPTAESMLTLLNVTCTVSMISEVTVNGVVDLFVFFGFLMMSAFFFYSNLCKRYEA